MSFGFVLYITSAVESYPNPRVKIIRIHLYIQLIQILSHFKLTILSLNLY